MELKGKRLDLLERANECARVLGRPQHAANQFMHLTPGERGIAVALQEYVDAKFAELRTELSSLKHRASTAGDTE